MKYGVTFRRLTKQLMVSAGVAPNNDLLWRLEFRAVSFLNEGKYYRFSQSPSVGISFAPPAMLGCPGIS